MSDVILIYYLNTGKTIIGEYYSTMIKVYERDIRTGLGGSFAFVK